MDVLLIGSLEISNVSNAPSGLQSQYTRDRDAGVGDKDQSKQLTKNTSRTFRIGNISDHACMYGGFR